MTAHDDRSEEMQEKPFLEHIEDLRRTLLMILISLGAGMAAAVPLAPTILRLLKAPLRQAGEDPERFLRTLEISGGFSAAMQIVFWSGLVFSAPLIFVFVWNFIFPGLTRRERRTILGGVAFAVILFASGVAMGYKLTLPTALRLMLGVNTWLGLPVEFVTINSYISFASQLLIAFGLAFELPVVVLILGSLGIVSAEQLRRRRPHVIVLLFIVATVLTPPDVFSQILMAIPLVGLYEICVWIVWARQKRVSRIASAGSAPHDT